MKLERFEFAVTGIFPLLTHNPASMQKRDDGTAKKKSIPSPEEEAEQGLYKNDLGQFCIPTVCFRSSFLNGLKGLSVKRAGGGRAISAAVAFKPAVFVEPEPELVVLVDPDSRKPLKTYELDVRRAVVQHQGIVRSRPKFKRWGCLLPLLIDTETVNPAEVEEHLNSAGQKIGVGDFRIANGGPFGSFKVELMQNGIKHKAA